MAFVPQCCSRTGIISKQATCRYRAGEPYDQPVEYAAAGYSAENIARGPSRSDFVVSRSVPLNSHSERSDPHSDGSKDAGRERGPGTGPPS